IDFAYLIWEDFVYQVEHKSQKRSNEIIYPRFTKVIIDYFITRKPSISRRNRIHWHYVRDDALFLTIKVVSRHQTTQQYGAILPIKLTTAEIRNTKGKQPSRATTPVEPTDIQRTEAEQLKIVLKKSRQETHISQQSGSGTGEGTGKKSDESDDDRDEGSDSDSDESVKSGAGKDDDDDDDEDDDDNDDEEELAKDEEEDKETGKGGDEVRESEGESEEEEETSEEEEGSFDPIPRTPEDSKKESDDEEEQESRLSEEARIQEEEDADELYHDVNINQGRGLQVTQNVEDTHVTLTPVNPDGPQESSSMSSFLSSMLNPLSDVGVESIFTMTSSPIVSLETPTPIMTPSTVEDTHVTLTPVNPDGPQESSSMSNMTTTIEQQTALDESFVPNVPEIYMQEFWDMAKLHHTSIRFKIDTRKSVLDLEAFREMLHISPRIPNQPFADLPTEEEILDFLRFLGHSHDIRYLIDVNDDEEDKETGKGDDEVRESEGVESIFTTTSSLIVSLETPTPIMIPSTIATITTSGEAPIPPPTIPSIILEN
nr:hypothetical protein [Tanacetum cinerariifolium]